MTDEQIALARRAVACRGWKWLPGMLALEWAAPGMSLTSGRPFRVDDGWHEVGVYAPDLTDPATLGCLVTLVRELYHAPWKLWDGHIEVRRDHQTLFFAMQFSHTPEGFLEEVHVASGQTETEAWVAALEAAP